MATIFRAAGSLTSPRPDALLVGTYGIAGIAARYHADSLIGNIGDTITEIADITGNVRTMPVTAGTVKIGAVGGLRTMDFSTAGTTNTMQSQKFSLPASRSGAWLLRMSAGESSVFSRTGEFSGSRVDLNTNGNPAFYIRGSSSLPLVQGTTVSLNTWLAVIATWDADAEVGTLSVNGVTASGAIDYTSAPAVAIANLALPPAMGGHVRDMLLIDHVLSSGEIVALTTGLLAQAA